jgi:hypothetical protein
MNIEKAILALIACVGEERFREELEKVQTCQPLDDNDAIRSVLADMGIPRHMRGWQAFVIATELVQEQPERNLTTDVYPEVGRAAGCTGKCAEKRMRSAVEWMWNHMSQEKAERYFPGRAKDPDAERPTVGEVLAVSAMEASRITKKAATR